MLINYQAMQTGANPATGATNVPEAGRAAATETATPRELAAGPKTAPLVHAEGQKLANKSIEAAQFHADAAKAAREDGDAAAHEFHTHMAAAHLINADTFQKAANRGEKGAEHPIAERAVASAKNKYNATLAARQQLVNNLQDRHDAHRKTFETATRMAKKLESNGMAAAAARHYTTAAIAHDRAGQIKRHIEKVKAGQETSAHVPAGHLAGQIDSPH